MSTLLVSFLLALSAVNCSQQKQPLQGQTEWQKTMNTKFKDATTSPLLESDLKNFKALDFFENDSAYVVEASLERTSHSEFFSMKTTTSRLSEERIFGILKFQINGDAFQLNVYQGKENMQTPGFEDYLFLPFLDLTNGESTYEGGRYIDLRIPEGNTMMIDFNKAYNPYCVYNEGFSCPIVPRVNFLNTKVEAGMKRFDSSK